VLNITNNILNGTEVPTKNVVVKNCIVQNGKRGVMIHMINGTPDIPDVKDTDRNALRARSPQNIKLENMVIRGNQFEGLYVGRG
jgi:hypothetical protein